MQPVQQTLENFQSGVINTQAPDTIPATALSRAVNMEFDDRSQLRTRRGLQTVDFNLNLIGSNAFWTPTAAREISDSPASGYSDITNLPAGLEESLSSALNAADRPQHVPNNGGEELIYAPTSPFFTELSVGTPYIFSFFIYQEPLDAGNRLGVSKFDFTIDAPGSGSVFSASLYSGRFDTNTRVAWQWEVVTDAHGLSPNIWIEEGFGNDWSRVYIQFLPNNVEQERLTILFQPSFDRLATYTPQAVPEGRKTDLTDFLSETLPVDVSGSFSVWGFSLVPSRDKIAFSVLDSTDAQVLTDRITSIFEYENDSNERVILVSAGSSCYYYSEATKALKDITNSVSLPDGTYWSWIVYDNIAYACTQGDSGAGQANIVQVADVNAPLLETVTFTDDPPDFQYITLFRDRLWGINAERSADNTNTSTVTCSNIGNVLAYTESDPLEATETANINVGGREGSGLTALFEYRDRLFLCKSDRIYYLEFPNNDNDINNIIIRQHTAELGCVSPFTVADLLDDKIFLSSRGIASLQASERFGDFEGAILSQNIADLSFAHQKGNNAYAVVDPESSQYILSFPTSEDTTNNKCWVMDYTNVQGRQGQFAFTEFTNDMIGTAFGYARLDGRPTILVGTPPNSNNICYLAAPRDNEYIDPNGNYPTYLETAALSFESPTTAKRFHRFVTVVNLLTDELNLTVRARVNLNSGYSDTWEKFLSGSVFAGDVYDEAVYDNAKFAQPVENNQSLRGRFVNQRYARTLSFLISSGREADSGAFIFKGITVIGTPTDSKRLVV